MDAQDKCAPGPVGCVGHCMNGRYITTAASRQAVTASEPMRMCRTM